MFLCSQENQYLIPNIVKYYFKILEVVSHFHIASPSKNQVGKKSKKSEIQVVALSLTAESSWGQGIFVRNNSTRFV